MIREALIAAGLWAGAGPVMAQGVDWRAAGGDMFGDAPAATPVEEAAAEFVRLPDLDPPFRDAMAAAAARHGLDVKLLHALVVAESGFRPDAVSPVGAGGLTQLMPATAAELGVEDRFDPVQNLNGGAAYLVRQLRRFGDVRLALAAFNAGPARVERLGRVPKIPETAAYVDLVLSCYLALAAGRDVRAARDCRSREEGP